MEYKILFSNIGYAKGIDGTLWQHIGRFHRHVYTRIPLQQRVLQQLKTLIETEQPDLCCFVEIDQGSPHSARMNQMLALMDETYHVFDVADKYGENSILGRLPFHIGKSNGFMAKTVVPFEKLYFTHGTKRLLYKLMLPDGTHLYFGHFSLQRKVRIKQFQEINHLVKQSAQRVIILADFNIMQGFAELKPLLEGTNLQVLNREAETTFRFHKRQLALDLCVCSADLVPSLSLKIIPQPFSDHAALLVTIHQPLSSSSRT